jgi:hypothetical protein
MAHFAKIESGKVTEVLVITQEEINTGNWGNPAQWVQTSYNTRQGVYYTPGTATPDPDQSKTFRKNYASVGMIWDAARNMFYFTQPFPSWTLNEQTGTWVCPVPLNVPDEDLPFWKWNETDQEWVDKRLTSTGGNA